MSFRPDGSRTSNAWTWVAGMAGVMLVVAIVLAVRLRSDAAARRRQIDDLMRAQQRQTQAGDYAAAWSSLEQALRVVEPDGMFGRFGQLTVEGQRVRTAQQDLAMAWVDDLRVEAEEKYSPIVDQVSPVMIHGAASATGTRKANLLAHVGWAMFFKSLDGAPSGDPATLYRAALAEDATNPYAHAYLGHWIAWSGGSLDDAMKEFGAAVATDRGRLFARRVQREALRKRGPAAERALIALVTEIRMNGETI